MLRPLKIHLFLFFSMAANAVAATYYMDATGGNDGNDGKSPSSAWRSLEKFNRTEFTAGDIILFKSGEQWQGSLRPKGSGSERNPVTICSYGEGNLPRVNGEGNVPDTLLLEDVEHWNISRLAITNKGQTRAPWRTGVKIHASHLPVMRGITLRELHVHDVNGDLRKSHEGCGIYFETNPRTGAIFDGLLIENCRVERTDRNGICQRGTGKSRSKNIVIRGNRLTDIGGDGIKLWGTNGGLIERNVIRGARTRCEDYAAGIWPFACDDTIIQFNEVSGMKGTLDGQAFDSDYFCKRTIIQYNYSYDNEGGFILVCSPGNAYNSGTIVRYNISVHDGINTARVIQIGGNPDNTHFYNNTFVLSPGQRLPLISFNEWNGGAPVNTRFSNNLVFIQKGGMARYDMGIGSGSTFSGNWVIGEHDGHPEGVGVARATRTLPRPIDPAEGASSVKDLIAAAIGPIPRGISISDNGGRDYFGNRIQKNSKPATGARQ